PVPLKEASLIVEINATDGDAGIQPSFDGDPWQRAVVRWPDGRVLVEVQAQDALRSYGLTELFSESSEPPFGEFSLDRFKELFPEGDYRFEVTGVDGTPMVGTASLSHDFPAGPVITSPDEDARVRRDEVVVGWEPVTEPAGIEIGGYQVLVVQEEPVVRTFSADLPAEATRLAVPAGFLQPGVEYKIEVLAVAASGNKTLTERAFQVTGG
ncbi:MAG: hypothetical protein ABWZ82_03045, partial [Candidatus Limnocylindrales bacterium]